MSVYFTDDTHFGHTNVIKHCKRPYGSIEELIKSRTAEMELAGRIIKENGKALYRQDDVRWLMDKQDSSVATDKSEALILN
ncbi:MAG TPA: hypothetical protein DCZ94_05450 [Lentisphaeria bacterium]|nr:MAG: hypothetical protein A2X48_00860 [Lentisphaerae bacterium GWF2_49_21]HBC86383.1 hypothetical protein [Lentisphaeria bacterium]